MHRKKMIAPIVITVLLMLYYLGFAGFLILGTDVLWHVKLIAGLLPLPFAGVSIYVLIERIKEIRSGEEDDLSEY